jgi:outer membrane protein
MRICLRALIVSLAFASSPAAAQETAPGRLSLSQALEIARTTNPGFLQTRNDEAIADWDVRQAWGALLPSASANGGLSWQGSGETQLSGGLTLADLGFGNQPSYYGSSYSLGLNYSLNWATILGPKQTNAQRQVTRAGIGVAEATLTSQVTRAYVELLRQADAVRIAELQLENAEFNLRLAQGQLEVGQVTPIDVGQAEVQVGRARVFVLQARNLDTTARMRLLQLLGLQVDQPFEATSSFTLSTPRWDLETLKSIALEDNPELKRRRLSTESSNVAVSSAWSSYLPSMSISTGWSGFTRQASSSDFQVIQAESSVAATIAQCARTNDLYSRLVTPLPVIDCAQFAFTDIQRQAIISGNDQFPFNFTGSPPSLRLTLSIPIFSGLSRQRNLEAARVQRDDLRQQVREQELTVEANLSIGLANLQTAYQSALLQEQNRVLAEQQLNLARQRYQLGAITFVELVDAQTLFLQAEADLTVAIFLYHDFVTTLEALVGASLRP